MKRKEKVDLIIISIPGLFLGMLLKGSLFSTYRIKVTEMLFIRQKTLITRPSFWIWNEAGRVEVDRGRVGHAGDLSGSARFLGSVFRVQPKLLDEIGWNFIFQLRRKFSTKFTGYPLGGGRQGGELDVWAYMKGYLNDFFKTDPCAREFRQRSIIALNMVMCALNVRPLQEVKSAILDPLWDYSK